MPSAQCMDCLKDGRKACYGGIVIGAAEIPGYNAPSLREQAGLSDA